MFYIDLIKKDKLSFRYILNRIKGINIEYIRDFDSAYGTNVDNLFSKIKINMFKINSKTIKKLDRIINIILEKNVYLSNNLLNFNNEKELNFLKRYLNLKGVNILNNKNKLFNIMLLDILEKIVIDMNIAKSEIRIGIIISEINQDFIYYLEKIAKDFKEIVIITEREIRLENIINKLYEEYGIIISLNNKSLFLKSNIVINFGLKNKSELNFIIGRCICINLTNSIIYNDNNYYLKILDGIYINSFKLEFDKIKLNDEYKNFFEKLKDFNDSDIYESLILKNTSIQNIIKLLKEDNINIKYFIGNNGNININEFVRYGNFIKNSKRAMVVRKK